MTRQQIYETVCAAHAENEKMTHRLTDKTVLTDYAPLVRNGSWANAINIALREHEILVIPDADEPYFIDAPIIVPSHRRIEAGRARIRQKDGMRLLMLRNEHTMNGTHAPIAPDAPDEDITIVGGIWEECRTVKAGYGVSGLYDEERSFFGVSTCMLFNNIRHITLRNASFVHCGGFAIQCGDAKSGVFEDLSFITCHADGLHLNGNIENILVRGLHGYVDDDLLAVNLYDWQNSSVDFGPGKCIWCEDLSLSEDSRYQAVRIEPGLYTYDDGTTVDCSVSDFVLHKVKGIRTFKMYFQTPAYNIHEQPERGGVGSGGDLYFSDMDIDLCEPIDAFREYTQSDPAAGSFAAFEVGSNIRNLSLSDIRLTLHRDVYPYSYLLTIGPKSCRVGDMEVFDPCVHCALDTLTLENVTVNGETPESLLPYIREVRFKDLYADAPSTGEGIIKNIRQ